METDAHLITRLLQEHRAGNQEAERQLVPLVYLELRRLAAAQMSRERPGNTLQTTALLHEAYLKLFREVDVDWQSRAHFFAVATRQMRFILIDRARARLAQRRGGSASKASVEDLEKIGVAPRDESLVALDEALKRLAAADPRAAQVVELRFFGGMEWKEIAEAAGASLAGVKRDWAFAKSWLYSRLESGAGI